MSDVERLVYYNGDFVPEKEARISIFDSALMFGDMVFEMTRSFNKHHFKLKEHIQRLFRSMKYLRIDCGYTQDEIENACYEISKVNETKMLPDDEHRLMIDVTRGTLSIYNQVEGTTAGPNLIITDFPLRWTVSNFSKYYDTGINGVFVRQIAPSSRIIEPKIKHRSRLYLQMANIQASLFKGEDNWAIMLDDNGYIAEGTGDNIFIVKDEIIYTPEGRNILRGISRDFIFELCTNNFIECRQKNIEPYDLMDADEAFITGTPFCILPMCKIDGQNIGNGLPGETTNTLLRQWGYLVGVDIVKQIKNWNENNTNSISPYRFGE